MLRWIYSKTRMDGIINKKTGDVKNKDVYVKMDSWENTHVQNYK